MKNILLIVALMVSFDLYANNQTESYQCANLEWLEQHTELTVDILKKCKEKVDQNQTASAEDKVKIHALLDKRIADASQTPTPTPTPTPGTEGGPTAGAGIKCDDLGKTSTPFDANTEELNFPGSDLFQSCDRLSRGHLKNVYQDGTRKGFNWGPYLEFACRSECNKKKEDKIPYAERDKKDCVDKQRLLANKCESAAYLVSAYERDWKDGEINKPTPRATTASTSSMKCVSAGIETLDYDKCNDFKEQLEVLESVQQVAVGAQELVYQGKMMDAQTKYATEENSATGALKATGDSLKMQQDMYQQRSVVDAAKLAYLYSVYQGMPKTEEVQEKCQFMNNTGDLNRSEVQTTCKNVALTKGNGFAFLMNQSQIDTMKSKLVTIATSTGSNLLLAKLLGKRADDVANAIAKIEDFKPIDPYIVSEEDAKVTFCKLNPGLAQCLTGGLDRTFDILNDNVISFGEGGAGTVYANTNSLIDGSGTGTDSGTGDRASVAPVGSIIAAANKDNSMEDSTAATVAPGSATPSGGGGGGGGASAGGGGGGLPSAPAQGGVAAAVAGRTPSYGGGTGVSVMGGFGINKAKGAAKTDENPFGKLFGKDGNQSGGVVNFRDIASQKVGGKGDNLFDMISKRYTSVNADKRLLEYELTK